MKVTPGVSRTTLPTTGPDDRIHIDRIHYPPGGHTHWHLHTGEQVLYGEAGHGWVQFDGARRLSLDPGTAVHVAVGRRHWHGATPEHELVHLAVTMGGDTVWLGEVSAEEYLGDPAVGTARHPGEVVSAFIAALERRDLDSALLLVTEDVVYDNVPIGPVTGTDAVRDALSGAIGRAETVQWVVTHQVVAGEVVMNERLDRFLVAGRWIEVPVAGLFVLRDGRIAQWRDYFGLATYRRQS
jgi:limonene-1,2-epoxide hydrolase